MLFNYRDLVILFYKKFIKVSKNKLLDSLIISKGHATSAAYFILSDLGVLKKRMDKLG